MLDRPLSQSLSLRNQQRLAWVLLITPALITVVVFAYIALRNADPRIYGIPHKLINTGESLHPPFSLEVTARFKPDSSPNAAWSVTTKRGSNQITVYIYNDKTFSMDFFDSRAGPYHSRQLTMDHIVRRDFPHLRAAGQPNTFRITIDAFDVWTLHINDEIATDRNWDGISNNYSGFNLEYAPILLPDNPTLEWGDFIVYD